MKLTDEICAVICFSLAGALFIAFCIYVLREPAVLLP